MPVSTPRNLGGGGGGCVFVGCGVCVGGLCGVGCVCVCVKVVGVRSICVFTLAKHAKDSFTFFYLYIDCVYP